MKRNRKSRSGQTLLMFSTGVLIMFGMLGLVVDAGWAYFRKQAAQAAAQAAATAAVTAAFQSAGSSITCFSQNVVCQSETNCPAVQTKATTNIDTGCLYASSNGFATAGRQKVTLTSGTGTPPSGNGATPAYWVTA